jgi:NTP pyrophosphatase (non-canonical NTP hydrolase)
MFNGKLNKFCKDVNKVVVSKGFWDTMHESDTILREVISIDEAPIIKATRDAFISQKIALIMSECAEALEAMRKENYGLEKKDSFEDEIADVFIRLSDLCGELDIDIEKQISWKVEHNKSRPAKHGKSF